MANPRMYNPNSNMAATLSQFVNPGDTLYRNLAGAGSVLTQQIDRMTAEEKKQQGILDKTIDNTYRGERADVADKQWSKDFSLRERALAMKAANAKRARDKDAADRLSKQLFVENLDTMGDKYNVSEKEVVDQDKVGQLLKPWNAQAVITPEEQQAYIENEALGKANEELKTLDPMHGMSPVDKLTMGPVGKTTYAEEWSTPGDTMGKIFEGYGNMADALVNKIMPKSDYEKTREQVESNRNTPTETGTPLEELQKEHVGFLSDYKVNRQPVKDPTDMTKKELTDTFGSSLAGNSTKIEKEAILKSASERVAPLKAQYDAMPEGPRKEAMANVINVAYQQAASENAAMVEEEKKYQREMQTFNYKTMTKAQIDMNIAKFKDDLANSDPMKKAKAAAELKKILSTANLQDYKAKQIRDELDSWF